jgi:hypothetical protein
MKVTFFLTPMSILALVFLFGCAAPPAPRAAGAGQAAQPSGNTVSTNSVLNAGRDLPSEGVAPVFTFSGASFPCKTVTLTEPGPQVRVFQGNEPDEPFHFKVCLFGYTPGRTIQLQGALPNGTVRRDSVTATEGHTSYDWIVQQGDPPGAYRITAMQGQLSAWAQFNVLGANVWPERGAAGTSFRLTAAGFDPGTQVQVDILRDSPQHELVNRLTGTADAEGNLSGALPTARGDAPGRYFVVVGIPFWAVAAFEVQ